MNFLELCQELSREAATSGAIATVLNQSGESGRLVNWIAKAYRFVLNKHTDWTFLRTDVAFDTAAGNSTYTAAGAGVTEFGEWMFADGWRCYTKATGFGDEQPVKFMPYDRFRNQCMFGTQRQVVGRPLVVTERPDQSLQFWPTPDAVYSVVGEQFRAPARLAANESVPIFPAKFHDVIVYRALMMYGEYEGDATVFASAQSNFNRLFTKMEELYLPDWEQPGTLA